MTSLNGNFTTYEPQKSDLLQKYLMKQNSSAVQNSAAISTPLYQNAAPAPLINTSPEQDSFENNKNNSKNAKIAAASLSGAMLLAGAALLGKTNAGKKLLKQASSLISSGYEKVLQKLREKIGSEKFDNAIRKFYNFRDDKLLKFQNASSVNLVNGKDVFSRNTADFVTGRKIDMSKLSGPKKTAAKIYQNTIGKVLSWFHLLDKHSTKLYESKSINGGIQGYIKSSAKYDDYSKTTLEELKKVLNANPEKKFKIGGSEKTGREILQNVESLFDITGKNVQELTSEANVKNRMLEFNNMLKGLDKNGNKTAQSLTEKTTDGFMEKIKGKKLRDLLTEPVAGKVIEQDKAKYTSNIKSKMDSITHTASTVIEDNTDNITGLRKLIGTQDIDAYAELDRTIRTLDKYKRAVFDGTLPPKTAREEICTRLDKLVEQVSKTNNPNSAKAIDTINGIKKAIMENVQGGSSEEILDIAKQVLEPDVYNKVVLPKYRTFQKTIQHAYHNETIDVLDKLRDINCGSAPTDFMTLIGSTALLGVYAAQAENNDERISLGLSTGLPLISTVSTNLGCAIKSISGGKAMAVSLGIGAVTKFICDKINAAFRKSKGLDENAKPSIVTIDDYIPYKNKFGEVFLVPAGGDLNEINTNKNTP